MPTTKKSVKSSATPSHFGAGLLAGALLAAAAAAYVNTPKGKKMAKSVQTKAAKMQTKLMKELKSSSALTKDKYAEIVDHLMESYAKGSSLAKEELPQVRDYLLKKWSDIQKQLK